MAADQVRCVQQGEPICDVTLFGTDCVSVSAAFFLAEPRVQLLVECIDASRPRRHLGKDEKRA